MEEEVNEEVMAQEGGTARMRTRAALQGGLPSGGGLERTAHARDPAGGLPSSGGLERTARVATGSQAAARRRKGGGGGDDLKKTWQRRPVRDPWGRVVGGGGSADALSGGLVRLGSGRRERRKPKIDSLDS
jgi:hypothetical protein